MILPKVLTIFGRTLEADVLMDNEGGSKSGQTASGTKVSASDQIANTQTGSADHLELGMRKET